MPRRLYQRGIFFREMLRETAMLLRRYNNP